MSKIEDLIQQYCPDGVEYRTLGEVCKIVRGERITKKDLSVDGKYPVMSGGTSFFGRYSKSNRNANTITIAQYGSAGVVSFITEDFWANDVCYSILPLDCISNKYLYYCLCNNQQKLYSLTTKAIPDCLPKERLESIDIPLPPLPVQEEIVRILDNFTTLEAELEAELEARQQQYQYYRDNLLSFDGRTDVEWKKLGDVATFTYGYTAKAQEKGGVRYIRITDITEGGRLNPENCKYIEHTEDVVPYLLQKGDLLIARTGATYGKTLYFDEDYPSAYASFLIKLSIEEIVLPKFYWHYSRSKYYWEQAHRLVGGGAQPQFNTGAISQVAIPIPPLAVQQRIVAILDRFDTLVNDISQGLPAEIAARKKQYEYYRDKLLTFKRKEA